MGCCHHHNSHDSCIKSVPIFNSLTDEEMLEVAHITKAKTFEKGEMVYMSGDKHGTLFVLHTGRVKITRLGASGKEQVIRMIGPGEFMGELSLFRSLPFADNAQVLETSTMCIIEGARLKELMAKYSSIAFKVMDELSRRLEKAETLIESINLNTVEQRLAQALLSLSEGKKEIVLNMTKGDFASHLGMSQETLSRKLTAFQGGGLIELIGQRKIKIKNRMGLEEIQQT
ncbi:MAG TPA: Crp/Fnr family transcriptional regulator [Ruminococcaceae bacterium]|nr:Crp/Fnr family transcriptional regulator [Oscillospiraceae bacterium]